MNRGHLFILLATIFFSSMETALKFVAADFNPVQLNFSRFLIGGLLLLPFALHELKKRNLKLRASSWTEFALLGLLGLTGSMLFYQFSILHAPASVVSVLFSCNPVLVYLFAFLILKVPLDRFHIIALLLEITAAALIIDPLHTTLDPEGVALVLISAALFALYAVLGKKTCTQYSGLSATCFTALAASAEMALLMLLSHIPFLADSLRAAGLDKLACIPFAEGYTLKNLPVFLYICIFVTAGGYACHFMGIERTSPVQGSLVFFFKPVLAPLLAMFILGEHIPLNMWAGIAVMLAASMTAMYPGIHAAMLMRSLKAGCPDTGIARKGKNRKA